MNFPGWWLKQAGMPATNEPTNHLKVMKQSQPRKCYGAVNASPARMDIQTTASNLTRLDSISMVHTPNISSCPPGHYGAWNLYEKHTRTKISSWLAAWSSQPVWHTMLSSNAAAEYDLGAGAPARGLARGGHRR